MKDRCYRQVAKAGHVWAQGIIRSLSVPSPGIPYLSKTHMLPVPCDMGWSPTFALELFLRSILFALVLQISLHPSIVTLISAKTFFFFSIYRLLVL